MPDHKASICMKMSNLVSGKLTHPYSYLEDLIQVNISWKSDIKEKWKVQFLNGIVRIRSS